MKHITLIGFATIIGITGCMFRSPEKTTGIDFSDKELIKRGQHLVTVSACHDCHSPKIMTPEGPVPDPEKLLSGHPKDEKLPAIPAGSQNWILFSQGLTGFVGSWGISYAANLTPDDTGIGNWSFEQFKTAIRKGKYKGLEGSRSLLPPMPWEMYRNFSDDELKAIFAYLHSLKPVENLVPSPIAPNEMDKIALK
ncbi:MAG: c-type cytochrome [Cyclobacteriaceae bacterium]|nr:c-type cytochrome [Cyclobacteriaceae bacterium]UYN85361.1 MAG: c-type cytochrome [Cyclobacteriaceae bacterium]